ncbi:hypothetical protein IWQ60_009754 [Tieghemiomyces parasiticus]|uniref:Uncharacterized protein n=1 Tax=Tieghemiomyces parasiticus TaxID=78921 RepID=A0A9W7ZWL5_9FUNG|nr:hypothetical protein IWQ60_009754 [Tieghemiomyces parasiticus]
MRYHYSASSQQPGAITVVNFPIQATIASNFSGEDTIELSEVTVTYKRSMRSDQSHLGGHPQFSNGAQKSATSPLDQELHGDILPPSLVGPPVVSYTPNPIITARTQACSGVSPPPATRSAGPSTLTPPAESSASSIEDSSWGQKIISTLGKAVQFLCDPMPSKGPPSRPESAQPKAGHSDPDNGSGRLPGSNSRPPPKGSYGLTGSLREPVSIPANEPEPNRASANQRRHTHYPTPMDTVGPSNATIGAAAAGTTTTIQATLPSAMKRGTSRERLVGLDGGVKFKLHTDEMPDSLGSTPYLTASESPMFEHRLAGRHHGQSQTYPDNAKPVRQYQPWSSEDRQRASRSGSRSQDRYGHSTPSGLTQGYLKVLPLGLTTGEPHANPGTGFPPHLPHQGAGINGAPAVSLSYDHHATVMVEPVAEAGPVALRRATSFHHLARNDHVLAFTSVQQYDSKYHWSDERTLTSRPPRQRTSSTRDRERQSQKRSTRRTTHHQAQVLPSRSSPGPSPALAPRKSTRPTVRFDMDRRDVTQDTPIHQVYSNRDGPQFDEYPPNETRGIRRRHGTKLKDGSYF